MSDPKFERKVCKSKHVIWEIWENGSNYHIFCEFSIATCIFYRNSIVLSF